MPINLANVNISLQQFQDISHGKYNAGEVKLASETTLVKVNDHVTRRGQNTVPLSHEEVLAVKNAFIRALSGGGVGADEIARVRKELGLAPESPADRRLAQRAIKPLSRQQIRDILDRNAGTINAHEGAETIRTSQQIYAGIDERTRRNRIASRVAANTDLAGRRTVTRNDDITLFQSVVAGDVATGDPATHPAIREVARQCLADVLHGCNGQPRAGVQVELEWRNPAGGASFKMAAGVDEPTFVRRLEELIVRLQPGSNGPWDRPLSDEEWNERIVHCFTRPERNGDLLPGFRQVAIDAAMEAQARFGEVGVKSGAAIASLVWKDPLRAIVAELGGARLTPENLRAAYTREAILKAARNFTAAALAPRLAAAGGRTDFAYRLATGFLERDPALCARLVAANSPAEARAILAEAGVSAAMDAAVARHVRAAKCCAGAQDAARRILSERILVPVDSLQSPVFQTAHLRQAADQLLRDIDSGANPASTPEEIDAVFRQLEERYVGERLDLRRRIDETGLNRNAKDWMKHHILSLERLSHLDPAAIEGTAADLPPTALARLFEENAPKEEIVRELLAFAKRVTQMAERLCQTSGVAADAGNTSAFAAMLVKAILAPKPELEQAVGDFLARPDVRAEFNADESRLSLISPFLQVAPNDAEPHTWRAWAPGACHHAGDHPEKVDALIAAAIRGCGDDADLRKLVFDNLDLVFVRPDATLRQPWDVAERIAELKANLAELRELAAAEPGLLKQGLELLGRLHGRPMPAGLLRRLVQAAWEQPTDAMQRLKAGSKGLAIHKAVEQMHNDILRAIVDADASAFLSGYDERSSVQLFLAQRILSGLSDADRAGFEAAIASPNASKLLASYNAIHSGAIDPAVAAGLSDDLRNAMRATAMIYANQLQEIAVSFHFLRTGIVSGAPLEPFPGDEPPALASYGARGLDADLVRITRERIAKDMQVFLAETVGGSDPLAARVRNSLATHLGPENSHPGDAMLSFLQTSAGVFLNRSLAQDLQNLANNAGSQFDKDYNRVPISLAGVPVPMDSLATARDTYARFATGNADATYARLNPAEKKKADLLMALSTQSVLNALSFSTMNSLSQDGRAPFLQALRGQQDFNLEMRFGSDGALVLEYREVRRPQHIGVIPDGNIVDAPAGTEFRQTLTLRIDLAELERFAALDFRTYNDAPVRQVLDVQKPADMYSRAKFAIPQPFRLRADVGVTFSMNIGAPAPAAAPAGAAPLSDAEFNRRIGSAFRDNVSQLPPGFREMVLDVREEVRRRFGESAVPDTDNLTGLAPSSRVEDRLNAPGAPRATPAGIRGWYLELAMREGARQFAIAETERRIAELGGNPSLGTGVFNKLAQRHPAILDRIAAAANPAAARAVFAEFAAEIDAAIRRQAECARCQAVFFGQACAALAERLGVPVALLETDGLLDSRAIGRVPDKLVDDILEGRNPADSREAIETAFRALLGRFVTERIEFLDRINALPLSTLAKDRMKRMILSSGRIDYLRLDDIVAAARALPSADLVARLDAQAPKADVYAAMHAITQAKDAAANTLFEQARAAGKEVGPDELGNVGTLIAEIFLDLTPGLRERIAAFLRREDVAGDNIYDPTQISYAAFHFQQVLPEAEEKETLIASLGTPQLHPLHARALLDAARAEGLDLPAADVLALFTAGQPMGDELRLILNEFAGFLDTEAIKVSARSIIRRHQGPILAAQARTLTERGFLAGNGARRALAAGYHATELPMLAKTFALYKAATNCSDVDALTAVLDPQSRARRLFAYGGRFTESTENFRNGLRLLERYEIWFAQIHANIDAGNFTTPTERYLNTGVVNKYAARGLEDFLFAEIAINRSISLKPENPEDAFGMANNPAMRFVGRGYTTSCTNTVAQLPPEKRSLIYAVFDALDPLPASAADAAKQQKVEQGPMLVGRILRHYDAVAQLRASGTLDRTHLVPLLYGDFGVAPTATNNQIDDAYSARLGAYGDLMGPVYLTMQDSGATVEEAAAAIQEGRRLPNAPGVSSFNGHLEGLDGTAKEGRKTLVGDLIRPTSPTDLTSGLSVIEPENVKFTVRFPDGTALDSRNCSAEENAAAVAIADKIEAFCGKVHQKQLSSLYFALSQSAVGTNLQRGFRAQGIESDEHMALTFTLAKDNATGAVTVTYSEPAGFPFHFHWTATVALDGTTTTTPMVIGA